MVTGTAYRKRRVYGWGVVGGGEVNASGSGQTLRFVTRSGANFMLKVPRSEKKTVRFFGHVHGHFATDTVGFVQSHCERSQCSLF
jgi:hypothetical protein